MAEMAVFELKMEENNMSVEEEEDLLLFMIDKEMEKKRVNVGGMFNHSIRSALGRPCTVSWLNRCGR